MLALLVAIGACLPHVARRGRQPGPRYPRTAAASLLAAGRQPGLLAFDAGCRAVFCLAQAGVTQVPSQRGRDWAWEAWRLLELVIEGFLLVQVSPPDRFLQLVIRSPMPCTAAPVPGPPGSGPAIPSTATELTVAARIEKTNLNDYFQLQHAANLYEPLYPMFDPEGRRPSPSRSRADRGSIRPLVAAGGPGPHGRRVRRHGSASEPLRRSVGLQLVEQVSLARSARP